MHRDIPREIRTDESMRLREEAVDPERAVSEYGSAEKALVEKAARLQAILDTTVDGIITIN
jgi:hypothetical protein